jgi:hypothetical protein
MHPERGADRRLGKSDKGLTTTWHPPDDFILARAVNELLDWLGARLHLNG